MTLKEYLIAYNPLPSMGFVEADFTLMSSETLEALGITDESTVSAKMLHTAGKVTYFVRVRDLVSGDYQFSADGGNYSRQQVYDMAVKNIEQYTSEFGDILMSEGTVTITDDSINPYRYSSERELYGNW